MTRGTKFFDEMCILWFAIFNNTISFHQQEWKANFPYKTTVDLMERSMEYDSTQKRNINEII